MSDEVFWIMIIRMAERLISVFFGGGAIYLGYRLFSIIPNAEGGDADISLANGSRMVLTRIAPGVFFSLFGAYIIYTAVDTRIDMPMQLADGTAATASALNSGSRASSDKALANRGDIARLVTDLGSVSSNLSPSLGSQQRNDNDRALRNARIALLRSVWASEWGEFREFDEWARLGNSAAPQDKPWQEPAEIYLRGTVK